MWNETTAKNRVNERARNKEKIVVSNLTREMDFYNLGLNDVRRAEGVHIYSDVSNFHLAVAGAGGDKEKQKRIIRRASVLRRVQGELAALDEVGKIQLQSARFHGFCHKPYDGEKESLEAGRVLCAVKFAITLHTYLYESFNPVFSDEGLGNFRAASGIDSGRCLIANIGYRGDRQLICLGTPANLAAKSIAGHGTITVTERVYKLLPQKLQAKFEESGEVAGVKVFRASGLRWTEDPELADELDIKFDAEKWLKRTDEYRKDLPLVEMEVTGADVLVDPDLLSERNSKRMEAVAIFADIDRFTKCVEEAENASDNTAIEKLVRTFHAIRSEFQSCVEADGYEGLSLQHQGDCVLAIAHVPCGDDGHTKRCRKGSNIAIGIQSSMEHVLRKLTDGCNDLHVTVGAAVGQAVITRLGKKGDREIVCLGPEVTVAQRLQCDSGPKQIRVSSELYDGLTDETVKGEFKADGESYIASDLTFPKLAEIEDEKAARSGSLAAKATATGVSIITSGGGRTDRPYLGEI
jgi:class 3 adenylate cyclase